MSQEFIAKGIGIGLAVVVGVVGILLSGGSRSEAQEVEITPVEVVEPDLLTPLSVQTAVEVKALQIWIEDKKLVDQRKCKQLLPMQDYILHPYSRCQGN